VLNRKTRKLLQRQQECDSNASPGRSGRKRNNDLCFVRSPKKINTPEIIVKRTSMEMTIR
jgi:hypothetical protein